MRQASVLIADDVLYSITGKIFLQGVYTTDLTIQSDPSQINQLIFLFLADTDLTDPFKAVTGEVTLPGSEPNRMAVPIMHMGNAQDGRSKQMLRFPMIIPMPLLRPGKIGAKIIHDSGEIVLATPWIVMAQSSNPPLG